MKRSIEQSISEFSRHWKNYVLQSALAMLVLFVILLILHLQHIVITASIGATAFIVFTMPGNVTAQTRNVVGGHVLGSIFGALCALIPHTTWVAAAAVYALAVGLTIFAMVVLDMEHPPAGGTALGICMTGLSWGIAAALIISIGMLSLAHRCFRKHLRDLT
jgi:CBS-domain-containing membrane protein